MRFFLSLNCLVVDPSTHSQSNFYQVDVKDLNGQHSTSKKGMEVID